MCRLREAHGSCSRLIWVCFLLSSCIGSIRCTGLVRPDQPGLSARGVAGSDRGPHVARRRLDEEPFDGVNGIKEHVGSFSALFVRVNLCGVQPDVSHQEWSDMVFGSADHTVQKFYEGCSNGRMRMPNQPDVNYVVEQPVNISQVCSSLSCDANDAFGPNGLVVLAQEAEDELAKMGIKVSQYGTKVFHLPQGYSKCPMVGMGLVSCYGDSGCYAWVNGADPTHTAHEMGHNLGLSHATYEGDPYGDKWSAMGVPYYPVCHSGFHTYRLGWADPVVTMDSRLEAVESWRTIQLRPRSMSAENVVLLKNGDPFSTLYLTYLAPVGFEENTPADETYMLLVHQEAGKSNVAVQKSALIAKITKGNMARVNEWTVQLTGAFDAFGTVQICNGACSDPVPDVTGPYGVGATAPSGHRKSAPKPSSGYGNSNRWYQQARSSAERSCGVNTKCGDGNCDAWAGENCQTCPIDCKKVTNHMTGKRFCCGGKLPGAKQGSLYAAGSGCTLAGKHICDRGSNVCQSTCPKRKLRKPSLM